MFRDVRWLKNYDLLTFESVDSTNSEALRLAQKGVKNNMVIVANTQTAGRGRKGRNWFSSGGNLYASILLKTKLSPSSYIQLPFLVANVVRDSIMAFSNDQRTNLRVELKWPNDVFIEGKKVAGILLESINLHGENNIIIGVGVNIEKVPESLQDRASSLKDAGILLENPGEFLNMLMNNFDEVYGKWVINPDFEKIRKEWLKNAYNLGKVVTIDDGKSRVSGLFKDIDSDGAIRLQLPNGEICSFFNAN
jgi:BirA family biotin operon repressor/biotin-[acetyl-CoA-carboxylase] ligase